MKFTTFATVCGGFAVLLSSSCAPTSAPTPSAPARAGSASMGRVSEERPGLATGWGSEKKSGLEYVGFERASVKPVGTDAIFYNDAEGINAMAQSNYRVEPMQTAAGELVEWGIKGRFGYLATSKEYRGGRRFVTGKKGSSFSLMVKNRSQSRLEIVASVDGLDVSDGKAASFSKRGYIVQPGGLLEIDGFRTSRSSVAEFEFSSVAHSYANQRHGDTRNVGVIGIAVFTEKDVNPWKWSGHEIEQREKANAFATAP